MLRTKTGLVVFLLIFLFLDLSAQYFGRNKARYRKFDYDVVNTSNFEIYHYFQNDSLLRALGRMSEEWYNIHSLLLDNHIEYRNPIIFYEDHPDFQQTTAISSVIGIGTGGVTEGLKNRVVMPVMESNAQTDHVLGHELVHAFQYDLIKSGDSTNLNNIRNIPLWMVEGMAEYLSIGRYDANTAMWMRDAVINDDIPTLRDLSVSRKYFPYRYGQAFWAFVGGYWGDEVIGDLFRATAIAGLGIAADTVLGFNTETLSGMWAEAMKTHYNQFKKDSVERPIGEKILHPGNSGKINLAPTISPDGNYVIFLSEKNLFTIDLFVADIKSGSMKKVASTAKYSHIDAFSYVESGGSWSPLGDKFAFPVFTKGMNRLIIVDVFKGKILDEIEVEGVKSFKNPTWSPDGNRIVISGLVDGHSDLFLVDIRSGQVDQLTTDHYSDLQPNWSPDGTKIVFASDRLSFAKGKTFGKYTFNISELDLGSGRIRSYDFFFGANNLNPVYKGSGDEILFLSNRDGFRNIYRYNLISGNIVQMTDFFTGVSGITEYSPAISISSETDEVVYSHYYKAQYIVYKAPIEDLLKIEVQPDDVDFTAALLPPLIEGKKLLVDDYLVKKEEMLELKSDSLESVEYKAKFKLDYIGNTSVGVGASSTFGTYLVGGVNMLFSDIVGNNQIFAGIAVNGEIYDIGGIVSFLNQKNRVNWGGSIGHLPYLQRAIGFRQDTISINGNPTLVDNIFLENFRIFQDQVGLFSYFPMSSTRRIEVGTSFSRYSFRIDRINQYYDPGTPFFIGEEREKLDAPPGFNIWSGNIAYVGDNSYFGTVSPLKGHRFRVELSSSAGELNYNTFLADYRKYIYRKPISLAFRFTHLSRHGTDSDNGFLFPLFIGYPTNVRGYWFTPATQQDQDLFDNLLGSRMTISGVELRLPFTGPQQLSVIKSKMLWTELSLFFDAGVSWDKTTNGYLLETIPDLSEATPIYSTGVSLRVNLFGQLVIEPYYALPFQRKDITGGVIGVNFAPGW